MRKFALLSVSDKTDIVNLAEKLIEFEYEILATGNTAKLLKESGVNCIEVADYTSFPEIFSGRVKTLHPLIFGGILMRRDYEQDKKEAENNSVVPIDIVCVNLYPFPEIVKQKDKTTPEKIENIDIGGPSLIRAAAKNYKFVSVLTNPSQYSEFIKNLENGTIDIKMREKLAAEAFSLTAFYDSLIAGFFEEEYKLPVKAIRFNYPLVKSLRYGENPHQKAELFGNFNEYFETLHGKELSYNNIIDLVAAVETVNDLEPNSCIIVKHTNPCGSATGQNILDSYNKALSCDPISSFGGIVAFNGTVDKETATKLNEIFLEIVCAENFTNDALEILKKKKNRRLVKILKYPDTNSKQVKSVTGGLIIQDKDNSTLEKTTLKTVTEKKYNEEEFEDLKFAWTICKHTKSNAIVYVKNKMGIGIGAGQMSRVDAAKLAVVKAKINNHDLNGAVAASDAFFPFPDALEEIADNGITSIIQPGGSIRDDAVIKAANEKNISMIFTGIRNFKH